MEWIGRVLLNHQLYLLDPHPHLTTTTTSSPVAPRGEITSRVALDEVALMGDWFHLEPHCVCVCVYCRYRKFPRD